MLYISMEIYYIIAGDFVISTAKIAGDFGVSEIKIAGDLDFFYKYHCVYQLFLLLLQRFLNPSSYGTDF